MITVSPRATRWQPRPERPFGPPSRTGPDVQRGIPNEPYLRAEWRLAITESDGSLGQFGAWACHRRRQSRHGRARTGGNWQATPAGAGPAGVVARVQEPA